MKFFAEKLLYILALNVGLSAFAGAEVQLQLHQSNYFSEAQNQNQTGSYSSVGARLRAESAGAPLGYGLETMGLFAADGLKKGYLAAPEFYGDFKNGDSSELQLTVGRKRFTWSRFDEDWRLGIWQPNVRWDYLNPVSQGLTGFFFSVKSQRLAVTAFGSPVFLPDQGPEFSVRDGEFISSNRWFRQPESRNRVFGESRNLNYELDRPSEREVIQHSSYGLTVVVGDEKSGPWVRSSVANKPVNQLALGIECYQNLGPVHHFDSTAVVHPVIARHTVVTIESGLQGEDAGGWLSLTDEHPDDPGLPDSWAQSPLYRTRFYGANFSHRLPWQGFKRHWLKYGYMTLEESRSNRRPSLIDDSVESSMDRYPYKRVASLEWIAPLIDRAHRRLDTGLRYLYSFPERGGLLSAKLEFYWSERTRWDFGFDILGAGVGSDEDHHGLMSLYRNNDRVTGGLVYVF